MASRKEVFLVLVSFVSLINGKETLNNIIFNGDYEFIDLTYPFDNKTVYTPGTKSFTFTEKIEGYIGEDRTWYAINEFEASEHGGTHIDAPHHFSKTGKYVGDLPLGKLIVPLIIVDVSSIVNDDPNFVLYKHHLDHLLDNNMGKTCVIIFKFGWSKYFNDRTKYLGLNDKTGGLNFPGLSLEVAEWITSYKNIVGIGVDVASVDPGSTKDYAVHKLASSAGLYNIENVKLDREIPSNGCTALILPMKIAMGTGAPLRVVAICPK